MTRDLEVKSCEDFFRIKRNLRFDPNAYLAPPPYPLVDLMKKSNIFATKVRTLTYFGMEIHNGENVNLLRVNGNFLEGK